MEDIAADANPTLESSMDAFFSADTAETSPSEKAPIAESPAEQVAGPAKPEAEQVAEGAEEGEAVGAAPAEGDEIAPPVSADGKTISIEVPRWNTIYSGYKLAQQIQQFAPSVEAAQAQYESANDYRAMHADFQSADPENIDAFLDHWARESAEGFGRMAERLPAKLEALAPETYESLQSHFLQQKVEGLYAAAAESENPQDLYHAQLLDYKLTGKYRQAGEIKRPDPLAQRQAELDRRQADLDKRETARQQTVWNNVSTRIEQAKSAGLTAEIDRVLEPVKAHFAKAPELFDALRDRIASKVTSAIKSDFEWTRNHDIDLRSIRRSFDQAWKTGQKTDLNADAKALVDGYAAKARGFVFQAAKPLVAQATATLVQQSQAAHQDRAKSQDRRGPSGGGAPGKKSFAPQLPADANLEQKMDAFFATR